ncbi:S41 family peptidase [Occallatibacter riparius]|uniref:S41 family peptidase n=1 Tax=Occallatibacter riparius TaxID=1002689 RepID=A0A9J7BNG4_9BACT|nr:S41 family peptidase [Occallatibacter riparius]UWZ82709.1 S41 family peptidase [Occallatibacter riparius]
MTVRAVLSFLLLSYLPGIAQVAVSRASVQTILGFEDQTSHELSGWYLNPAGTVFADDQVAHSGRWSVRLQRDGQTADGFSAITRKIPVDFQGGVVELRGSLRLENISGYAGLWMREDADGQMLALENMQSQKVTGSHDWTEYRITLPLDAQAQELYFGVLASGSAGKVWADDLQFYVDGKPIEQVAAKAAAADVPADTEFDKGSRIQVTALSDVQVDNLVTLGRVWGFLKYHHPAVTAGRRNWDYDLFRVLPEVLAASDRKQADDAILKWIEALGPVSECKPCVPAPIGDLSLKPALEWIHDRSALGVPLAASLEQIYANRSGRQFYVSLAPDVGNPAFVHEGAYPQLAYADFGFQLLALFRWWNIMQYWAPDREIAGQDWPAVLAHSIRKVALAADKKAYELALFELIATANDTHANLWSSLADRPPTGECRVPVDVRFVNDKAVVYRTPANDGGLQAGDVIERLEGAPVAQLVADWRVFYADSNEAARRRDMAASLTRGACGAVSIDVTRAGKTETIKTQRVADKAGFATHDKGGDTFQLLSPSVAYVKLSSIKASDLPGYFAKAKGTKGLIVDIRNYPSEFMPFAIGQYFATKPTPFVSFTFAELANPGAFRFGPGPLIQPGPEHYGGKMIILVDEMSQSQAEYTAMALRAMPNALVVGSTTAGADGNVSRIPLPGNLSTMISGLGVYYPDHRQTQRVGIVPDVVAGPTIEGIAAGHDDVLLIALELIEGGSGASGREGAW